MRQLRACRWQSCWLLDANLVGPQGLFECVDSGSITAIEIKHSVS
jgi:hypothetical protein